MLVRAAFIPRLCLVRILIDAKHSAIRDCSEGFVGDGEVRLFGVDLCCLHCVDVLGANFGMAELVHYSTLDGDGANLAKADAVGSEVHNHGGRHDLGVVCASVLQILVPRIVGNGTK